MPDVPQVAAKFEITLLTNGQVHVNGPLENEVLAYGLFEIAKNTVRQFNADADKRIAPPPPGTVALFGRKL